MNQQTRVLLRDLPMCYGTYKDYCQNNYICYKDQLYLIEKNLIVSSHGYYYATPKGIEASK